MPGGAPNIKLLLVKASDIIRSLLPQKVCCNDLRPDGLGKSNNVVIQCEVTSVSTTVCGNVETGYKISGGCGFTDS